MGNCSVEVSLAERQRGSVDAASYLPGAPMNVLVTVCVDEDTTCAGLDLYSHLVPRGKGFSFTRTAYSERLFAGTLPAGTHTYRRQIQAPSFPSTYDGDGIGWDWWVEATADVPWATDPRDRERFTVRSPTGRGLALDLPPPQGTEALGKRVRKLSRREVVYLTLGGGCAAVALCGLALHSLGTSSELPGVMTFLGSLAAVILLTTAAIPIVKRMLGLSKAAPIDVAVAIHRGAVPGDYRAVDAGDALTCIVHTDPRVTVEWMKASLAINEWTEWTEGHGEHRRQREWKATQFRRVTEMSRTGAPGQWRGAIPLPEPPFLYSVTDAGGHGLVWEVQIHLAHSGGKDPAEPIVRRIVASPA